MRTAKSVRERLLSKIHFNCATGCWEWTASMSPDGYGLFYYDRSLRTTGAHRISYRLFVGEIPAGKEIDHLCRVRNCVNPSYLEAVTRKVNTNRGDSLSGKRSRQILCKNGHSLSGENLLPTKTGRRACRICRNAYCRESYRNNPARRELLRKCAKAWRLRQSLIRQNAVAT